MRIHLTMRTRFVVSYSNWSEIMQSHDGSTVDHTRDSCSTETNTLHAGSWWQPSCCWCFHLALHVSTAYYLQQPFIDAFTLHCMCQQLTTSNNLLLMLSPCRENLSTAYYLQQPFIDAFTLQRKSVNSLLPPTTFYWCFHLALHVSTAYSLQQPFIDAFTLHCMCQQLTTSNNLSLA